MTESVRFDDQTDLAVDRRSNAEQWLLATAALRPVYLIVLALLSVALIDAAINGGNLSTIIKTTSHQVYIMVQFAVPFLAAILLIRSYILAGRFGAVSHAAETLQQLFFSWTVILKALPVLAFSAFLAGFVHFKMRIPELGGYRWDDQLYALDKLIFGGMSGWEFFSPVYDVPLLVASFDFFYSLWIPIIFLFWCWMAYDARLPRLLRLQYLVTTVVTWVLGGNLVATVFGSVGPSFYGEIYAGQPDLFAGLQNRLSTVNASFPLLTSHLRDQLLHVYFHPGANVVGGISAMPSMHNAQAAILVLTALQLNRWLAAGMAVFGVLIVTGSIILGWHYASDSLAGMLIALSVWHASGYLLRRYSPAR
ncbi:MAG: phosphatase PAP2 family protein [Rhizobiaceae bacterium]